jgi:hypothetical protein
MVFLTLNDLHKLQTFENEMLRKYLDLEKIEVSEQCSNLNNEEF